MWDVSSLVVARELVLAFRLQRHNLAQRLHERGGHLYSVARVSHSSQGLKETRFLLRRLGDIARR
jgi:hypothetical protein